MQGCNPNFMGPSIKWNGEKGSDVEGPAAPQGVFTEVPCTPGACVGQAVRDTRSSTMGLVGTPQPKSICRSEFWGAGKGFNKISMLGFYSELEA